MIINIRITEAAIEHLQTETGLDRETCEELAQMVTGLCEISGRLDFTPGEARLRNAARAVIYYRSNPHWGIVPRDLGVAIDDLEKALCRAEGEGGGDLLWKTADSLMRFYAQAGSAEFTSRFGSLEILEPCRQILAEGEGNPHPWEGSQ